MSTTEPEPNETVEQDVATPPSSPQPSASAAAAQPTGPPPSAPYPPPVFAPQVPPGYVPYAHAGYDPAFAPIARAPRSRWIAPQRKAAVIVISIVSALLLLGIGAAGGSLITSHHDHTNGRIFSRNGFDHPYPPQGGHNGYPFPRPTRAPRAAPSPSATS